MEPLGCAVPSMGSLQCDRAFEGAEMRPLRSRTPSAAAGFNVTALLKARKSQVRHDCIKDNSELQCDRAFEGAEMVCSAMDEQSERIASM